MKIRSHFLLATVLLGCAPPIESSSPPSSQTSSAEKTGFEPFANVEGVERSVSEAGKHLASADDAGKAAIANSVVPAATRLYVEHRGVMSPQQRFQLISLLIRFNDERAFPAFEQCLAQLVAERGEKPEDLFALLRAYEKGHVPFLAPALLDIYPKYHAHTLMGGGTYRAFANALTGRPRKEWESTALRLLQGKVHHPKLLKTKAEKRAAIDPYRDELFWQITAAQILGEIRSERAVRPLFEILLDPSKGDIATTALLALVKIGEPAVRVAENAILGKDPELESFAETAREQATWATPETKGLVPGLAAFLGMSSIPSSEVALLRALSVAKTPQERALILRELPKPPNTTDATSVFQAAFEKLDCAASISGTPVCVLVAESVPRFSNPDLVPWLLKQAKKLSQTKSDAGTATTEALVVSAMKLATVAQLPVLRKAATDSGLDDLLTSVEEILNECKNEVGCYLAALEEAKSNTPQNQLRGIKAAHMVGVLGNPADAQRTALARPNITNEAVHFAALGSIDALLPKGDELVIETLRFQIDIDEASGDPAQKAKNAPARQVLYRLEARWIDEGGEIPARHVEPFQARLPAEVIRMTVRRNFSALRSCYEEGLGRDSKLEGRVDVRFVIARDGTVSAVGDGESPMPDEEVTQCVLNAFRTLHFPKPNGGIIKVTYPIAFSPG